MPSAFFNQGKNEDFKTGTYGLLLVGPGYVHDPDLDNISAIASGSELSGAGYARKSVTVTKTVDDANNRAKASIGNQTWAGANFGTVRGAILYREDAAADASRVPMIYSELSSDAVTNGGDFTYQEHADGIGYVS